MKIIIRPRHVDLDDSIREHIDRQLEFSLGRFSSRIRQVTARIVDLNGPRGGEDKSCRIEIQLQPSGVVFVEYTAAHLCAAVDRAADKAARTVSRFITRARDLDRDVAADPSLPTPSALGEQRTADAPHGG
jgi:putative sigma-54 modulation protein